LARHLIGGFQVGAQRGFLDVATLDGACRVHIHRHQGFGLVDHNRAAAGQLHGAAVSGLDLVFDLEAAKQRCVVAVTLHAVLVFRHHVCHELVRLLVNVVGVDQDLANIDIEIIADGANHQARFLVNQERTLARLGRAFNRRPQLEQIIQVPLQFTGLAANAGGAGNDAHAIGVVQLFQRGLQFGAVLALDAAAHATAARVVGHQHHIAARQADVGGQGRAFVAALFLFHLHQQFLAFADHVLDACLRRRHIALEVLARDFLERQETVALLAVIDKAGFQRRLHARDHRLVDVALALLAPFDLDLVIQQLLPVHNRQAAFFGLGGIDQHAFHGSVLFSQQTNRPAAGRGTAVNPLAEHENEEELPESRRTKRD
jgi:hypothetical protein